MLEIQFTDRAFAALRSDGSVVTWGDPEFGGDSSAVEQQLRPSSSPGMKRKCPDDTVDSCGENNRASW